MPVFLHQGTQKVMHLLDLVSKQATLSTSRQVRFQRSLAAGAQSALCVELDKATSLFVCDLHPSLFSVQVLQLLS